MAKKIQSGEVSIDNSIELKKIYKPPMVGIESFSDSFRKDIENANKIREQARLLQQEADKKDEEEGE